MMDYLELREIQFSFQRNGDILFRGTPDVVRVYEQRRSVVVADYKFGRADVQEPVLNMQLRAYLAMVGQVYDADWYFGAIIQPRISSKPHIVKYAKADVIRAQQEINGIWDAAHDPKAQRKASQQACTFCRAKALCPEFKEWTGALEKIRHLPVAQWTDEQMEIFELRRGLLKKFLDDTHEQIKAIKAADPERLPGWSLKPGNKMRHVTDIVGAWIALQEELTPEQFNDCCTVKITELERVFWELRKNTPEKLTQKEAQAIVNGRLKELIELKQNAPILVKDGK